MAILSSDPYQAAWQVIGMILVSLLLLGLLGLLFIKFIYPYLPGNVLEVIKEFFTDLIQYSPTAVFSFGFLHSIIFQSYTALIPNAFAILGLIINRVFRSFSLSPREADLFSRLATWRSTGAVGDPPRIANPIGNKFFCYISGMPFFDNSILPPSIILVTTIIWHYLMLQWLSGGGISTIAPSVTLAILLIGHITLVLQNCADDGWSITKVLLAVIAGIGLGSASMAAVKYGLNKGGSSIGPTGLLGAPKGNDGTPGVGTCSAPNDQDQFVCEAYKNGELITETVVE